MWILLYPHISGFCNRSFEKDGSPMISLPKYMTLTALAALLATVALAAKPKIIDRMSEKEEFPDLQVTEKKWDFNILDIDKKLNQFGPLVELGKEDRARLFQELKEPNDFRNSFRNIKYTPRNTYVRYVKESPEFIINGIGSVDEINTLIDAKTKEANDAGLNLQKLQFQSREGIELTQFDFIKEDIGDKCCVPVGSLRKSLTLYFSRANGEADTRQELKLTMVVARVVSDHLKNGVKDVELVIDPSPLDDNMDDILVFHRYNQNVPTLAILGTMSNTPNYPHRIDFKQKFYARLEDHFYRLYQLVDGYAHRDNNSYNEDVIQKLEQGLSY